MSPLTRPKRMARGLATLEAAGDFASLATRAAMREAYVATLRPTKRRAFWRAYQAQRAALGVPRHDGPRTLSRRAWRVQRHKAQASGGAL